MGGLMVNWQTSIPGFLSLAMAFWDMWATKTINVDVIKEVIIGLGLVAAKDWNVTGGTKQL